jgi:4-oxalomesaconate hydratase
MTGERVTENRLGESGRAAKNQDSEGHFFERGDYPRVPKEQDGVEPVNEFREHRPAIVLTDGFEDPYHMDHPPAKGGTLEAGVCVEDSGYPADGKGSRDDAPPVVILEPHQPEPCHFAPPVRSEITSIGERRRRAMESMAAEKHLVKYSTVAGGRRVVERASRFGQAAHPYAEAYQRISPRVTDRLS